MADAGPAEDAELRLQLLSTRKQSIPTHKSLDDDLLLPLGPAMKRAVEELRALGEDGVEVVEKIKSTAHSAAGLSLAIRAYVGGLESRELEVVDDFQAAVEDLVPVMDTTGHPIFDQVLSAVNAPPPQPEEPELELVGTERPPPTCPVTLKLMTDALKCRKCGHSYSREGIMMLLQRNAAVDCPVPGCTARVDQRSLVDDRETSELAACYMERR